MNNNLKKIPVLNEQELNIQFNHIVSQYDSLRNQAKQEIYNACMNGDLRKLINLRAEVICEITCNKFYIRMIDEAIKKRLRGDF